MIRDASERTEEALRRATELRRRLRDAISDAEAALASAEATNQQLHHELDRMMGSSGRRLLVGLRQGLTRGVRLVRHPLWTAGTVARGLASTPVPATVARSWKHLRRRTFPLRLAAPARRWTAGSDESLAIRWIGAVNLRHRPLEALLCHPPSGLEYQVKVPARSRFVCDCALSPQVWNEGPPPIEFTIAIRVPAAGDWKHEAKVTLDPARIWTHRRWHTVSVDLPAVDSASVEAEVTLSTRVAAGGTVQHAWALFGDPRFEWERSRSEVQSSLRTFGRRLRIDGVRSSLELLRTAGVTAQDPEAYARWVGRNTPGPEQLAELASTLAALPHQPLISIIVPVYNTDPRWLRAAVESVQRQVYPNWELCICDDASSSAPTVELLRELEGNPRIKICYSTVNGGISAASNAALQLARGEFVALLDHDDELAPEALAEVVRHLNARTDADVIYSDEDKLDPLGARCDPMFKPDWSPDFFLSCMYTCHLMVIRRRVLDQAGGFREGYEGAQDYDLLLRIMEHTGRIEHIPRVLYHWRKLPESTASAAHSKPWAIDAGRLALEDYVRRNALDADVQPGGPPGLYRVRRRVRGRPLVSIVIPTAGRPRNVDGRQIDLLAGAIESIVRKTTYRAYELIVVADEAGVPETTMRALEGTDHRILRFTRPGLFNFSAKVNAGAAESKGEHLLLFNDDLEVISGEWLEAMLEYSQEAGVGAVGAKLLYPDGRLQHIGIVLGVAGIAAHAFHQHPGVAPGYAGSAILARNYSAVTGACLLTRRAVFDEVGRFDERFPTDFNDVDYCLRVREAGYRVVYTPWAQLYHHESASFGDRRHDFAAFDEMRRRWAAAIDRDPYYNPNLTRDFTDYRLDA